MEEQILIESLSYGKAGIGHTSEGKAVFVAKAAPGDLALVTIEEDKGNYCVGRLSELIEASPVRVRPPCPFYDSCGGCPWQHLGYPAQTAAKRDAVVSALIHTAHLDRPAAEGLVAPCKGSARELGYRNKLEFGAVFNEDSGLALGFYKEGSHEIAATDSCLAAVRPIAGSPKTLRGALRYLSGRHDLGIFRVGVRSSLRTKDLEIALWTRPGAFPRHSGAQMLKGALKATSIVRVVADPGKSRKVKAVEALDGKGFWEERLGDDVFMTSAPSFFQVNTGQAEALVGLVVEGLCPDPGMRVADLYAGGGTFAVALARKAGTVLAVEAASSSVKDLRRNAQRNDAAIEVVGGDSARCLPGLGPLDAVVVDPPRAGLSPAMVEAIASAGPKRVAYVSCDPSTWARDVARLGEKGYALTGAQPVDLFPQTYHVEVVSFFDRCKG